VAVLAIGTVMTVKAGLGSPNWLDQMGPGLVVPWDQVKEEDILADPLGQWATQAHFGTIKGLCIVPDGALFVHDANHVIRKITPAGQVTTWAF
jgi:hypothetical protein